MELSKEKSQENNKDFREHLLFYWKGEFSRFFQIFKALLIFYNTLYYEHFWNEFLWNEHFWNFFHLENVLDLLDSRRFSGFLEISNIFSDFPTFRDSLDLRRSFGFL